MAGTTPPKGAKRPTDRKPKDGEPLRIEVDGKTWLVEPDALDDFELLDDLGAIEAGNAARMPSALRRMFGPEQYKKALDHLRDPDTKRVGIEQASDFIRAAFEELPQGN